MDLELRHFRLVTAVADTGSLTTHFDATAIGAGTPLAN